MREQNQVSEIVQQTKVLSLYRGLADSKFMLWPRGGVDLNPHMLVVETPQGARDSSKQEVICGCVGSSHAVKHSIALGDLHGSGAKGDSGVLLSFQVLVIEDFRKKRWL